MDPTKNFIKTDIVAGGINSTDATMTVLTGAGANFQVGINVPIYNRTDYSDPSDDPTHEIVRITAIAGDVLSITRAQEGTTAQNHNTAGKTYGVFWDVTAKSFKEIHALYTNGAPFWNAKHVSVLVTNTSAADVDFYTCPTGKKAILMAITAYQASGTAQVMIPKIKVSGTYFRAASNTSAVVSSTTSIRSGSVPINAGESLAINFNGTASINVWMKILEFDSNSPVTFGRILGGTIINGDNTLYTCPTGYSACPISPLDLSGATTTAVGSILYNNDTGGPRTLKLNIVPSGSSVGAGNLMIPTQSASNTGATALQTTFCLNAGDFVNINIDSNSASQAVWIIMFESPIG
jgi:hypothetical protein